MSNISRFFLDNYIWILVIILLTIVTIIGFLVDKKRNNKKEGNIDNSNANGVVNPNVQTNAINYNPNMQTPQAVNNVIPNVQMNQNNNQGQIVGTIPNGVAIASMDMPTNNYQPLSEQTPQVAPQPIAPASINPVNNFNNAVPSGNSTIPQVIPTNVNSIPNMMNTVPVYNQNDNNTVVAPLNVIPNANNNPMVQNNNLPNYNINPVNNNQNDYQQVNNISQPNNNPMVQNTNLPNGVLPNNNVMPQANIPNVNGQAVNFVYGPQGNNQN